MIKVLLMRNGYCEVTSMEVSGGTLANFDNLGKQDKFSQTLTEI